MGSVRVSSTYGAGRWSACRAPCRRSPGRASRQWRQGRLPHYRAPVPVRRPELRAKNPRHTAKTHGPDAAAPFIITVCRSTLTPCQTMPPPCS
jgi:hypothetical protein